MSRQLLAALSLAGLVTACAPQGESDAVELFGDDAKADGVQGRFVAVEVRYVMWPLRSFLEGWNEPGEGLISGIGSTVYASTRQTLYTTGMLLLLHNSGQLYTVKMVGGDFDRGAKGRFLLYQYVGPGTYDSAREIGTSGGWPHPEHWAKVDCRNADGQHFNYWNGFTVERNVPTKDGLGTLETLSGVRFTLAECGIASPDTVLAVYGFAASSADALEGEYAFDLVGDCYTSGCWLR